MSILRRTLSSFILILAACGGGGESTKVDVAAAGAAAGCETATQTQLTTGDSMLPGRQCLKCHKAGGQAKDEAYTAAGTVFGSGSAQCNPGGLSGVKVEILDAAGAVVDTLMTGATGNFYTRKPLPASYRARVSKNGKSLEMVGPRADGDCASCHQPNGMAGARIFLN